MIYMIITLFLIVVIEFSIYLILEFMNMRNQKLNEHDKTINHRCNSICNDNDICTQSNKDERTKETTSTPLH